jgi:hypothetical protein
MPGIEILIIAILTGILTTLVIRRTTNPGALGDSLGRIHAHLMELRLFFDEPSLVWQAQVGLLRENAVMLWRLLPGMLILALPMGWLFLQLEAVYGLRPLHAGEAAVVAAQLARGIEPGDRFHLRGVGGVAVETPVVRVLSERTVCWRIRAQSDGAVELSVNGGVVKKAVLVGDAPRLLSPRRYQSIAEFTMHPEESLLPEGDVEWVEVAYPPADGTWIAWFLGASGVAALVFARLVR